MQLWAKSQTRRTLVVASLILTAIAVLFVIFVDDWSDKSAFQQWVDIFQSMVTVIAIIFGGIFALVKLQAFRDFDPHLTVTHKVTHRIIGDSYARIEVVATLHNSSKVKIDVRRGLFLLQQISPVSDKEIEALYVRAFEGEEYEEVQWPTLSEVSRYWGKGELVIEPGESHPETLEFIVAKEVKSVMIYTYFHNPGFSEGCQVGQGWVATTVHDMTNLDRLGA